MTMGRVLAVVVIALSAGACSSEPTTRSLTDEALAAMGGADRVRGIRSYVMSGGTGSRSRLGQSPSASTPDAPAQLANVTETVDIQNGRVALAYDITTAEGFAQSRREVLTRRGGTLVGLEDVGGRPLAVMSAAGLFSWGTQNSPAMTLRRNPVSIVLAAADAEAATPTEDRVLNGRAVRFGSLTSGGEKIGLYFDPQSKLLAGYETLDTETMLGDVTARYLLEDYRDVAGVMLPHRIRIDKGGQHYADVQFARAAINDPEALKVFDIPEAANAQVDEAVTAGVDYSPVALTPIARHVHFAQAYSHNSLVVEFPTSIAVVEAPYTEAQSRTLLKQIERQFGGKPVRYVAVTHPHFDHTGGVRAMVAAGATILVARGHETSLRALIDARHTNPSDDLDTKRATGARIGTVLPFDRKHVLSEGDQSLELHAITGSPHMDPVVIAFVPGTGVLFQGDLYFPATGAPATPAAAHLLQAVRSLGLRVQAHAGGHGGVAPFDEMVKAVGR